VALGLLISFHKALKPSGERGQTPERGCLPKDLVMGSGRKIGNGCPRRYVSDDSTLRRNAGSGPNRQMTGQPGLSREDDVVFNHAATCHPHLGHDKTPTANP
jgi:hypothetical protein